MCKNLDLSSCHLPESRVRSKVHARFGGGQTEKEQRCHLAGWLPYSEKVPGADDGMSYFAEGCER